MNKIKSLLALLAALVCGGAWAEAPVPFVVFNGDLINGAHKNGKYAVAAEATDQCVTIANGYATTTKVQGNGSYNSHGIQISWPEAGAPNSQMTVLIKYSGYEKEGGRSAILSTLCGTHEVTFSQTWDNKFEATYDVSDVDADPVSGKTKTNTSVTAIPTSGVLMFSLCGDSSDTEKYGARVAFKENVDGSATLVEKFTWDAACWDGVFKNIWIAGTKGRRNRYWRPSITVEAVAIFDNALTVAEANEYVFPTLHRITDVSGETTWETLMSGRGFTDGDDVAIVMSGSSTITLPETPVCPGTFSVFGTGDMTIPAMTFPVVSGTQIIWARGFSGETLTKEGTNRLSIQNGDNNGSEATYEHIALDGTDVDIVDGTVELCTDNNGDAKVNNPTFNIGTYGNLDCWGYVYGKGTMTIENATDKTILTNRGGDGSNLTEVPTIVKKGAGKLTMTCNIAGGSATTAAMDIQAGALCLQHNNNKVLNGAITGAGSLEINVGADHTVKLGSVSDVATPIVVTSGALELSNDTDATFGQVISGTGKVVKSGTGVLTLSGSNTYTGGTEISAGTIKTSVVANLNGKAFAIGANGTLQYDNASGDDWNFDDNDLSQISGAGKIKFTGSGFLTLAPDTSNKLWANTLEVVNELANGFLMETATTYTIGSLSGSGKFRYDCGSDKRTLVIKQSKDTTWTGGSYNDGGTTPGTRGLDIVVKSANESKLTYTGANSHTRTKLIAGEGGTIKSTQGGGLGEGPLGLDGGTILLDESGFSNDGKGYTIVSDGGTIRKTSTGGNAYSKIIKSLTLNADTTITGYINGIGTHSDTVKGTLALGSNTLTITSDSVWNNSQGHGNFYFYNADITGTGKLKLTKGNLLFHTKATTATDATIEIGENASIQVDGAGSAYGSVSVKNLTLGSDHSKTCNGTITVTGILTYDSASNFTLPNAVQDNAALVKSGTGVLTTGNKAFASATLNGGTIASARALEVSSGVEGKGVGENKVGSNYTYILWDGVNTPSAIQVPANTTEVQLLPGQTATYSGDTEPTIVTIKAPNVTGPGSFNITDYFTIAKNNGNISATLKNTTQPTVLAMAAPTEEETDKVQFTITNPIPGLFYSVSSCDTPNGDFTSATGDQATSTADKTVSIPMEFSTGKKVKYYKVSVKATK